MRKVLLLLAIALVPVHAKAQELMELSPTERQALRSEIRAYLLDNPEILMEALSVLEERQAQAQRANDAAMIAASSDALFQDAHSYVMGNPEGDVTIVEFLDYRCGYCRRAHPEINALIASDDNIRVIIKELPILGQQSDLASRFALSVLGTQGAEAYREIHDALMVETRDITPDMLMTLAGELALDGRAAMDGIDNDDVNAILKANALLSKALNINGTPSFVIGDQIIRGYVPLSAMELHVAALRAQDAR